MTPRLDCAQLELHFGDQMQGRYALIRPLVLFAEGTTPQRAAETHPHPDTVRTFTRRFRAQGMLGLLPTDIEARPRGRAPRGRAPQSPLRGFSFPRPRPHLGRHVWLPHPSQDR
jgi:hypothetical protein